MKIQFQNSSVILPSKIWLLNHTIKEIEFSTSSKMHAEQASESFSIKTILESERDCILYILKKCNGKISGIG